MKIFLAIIFLGVTAWAYIPSSSFVFDRVSNLHGKGAYRMTMDVTFTENNETQVVKESWLILDGGEMRVTAQGEGFQLTHLLKRGKIYSIEQNGQERSSDLSLDAFMPPLLIRNSLDLKRYFVRWGALPVDSLKEKRMPKESKDVKVESDPFVRLGRANGAVQYEYGPPPNSTSTPGVWIEQDHFFITKMRSPTGAEFTGQNYIVFAKNLAFPKIQTIIFNGKKTDIKVTSVSGIDLTAEQKRQMDFSWMRDHQEKTQWPSHSLSNSVQEFYKHFR